MTFTPDTDKIILAQRYVYFPPKDIQVSVWEQHIVTASLLEM